MSKENVPQLKLNDLSLQNTVHVADVFLQVTQQLIIKGRYKLHLWPLCSLHRSTCELLAEQPPPRLETWIEEEVYL